MAWMVEKLQNGRVRMCVKEVMAALSLGDRYERAGLLVMAHGIRLQFEGANPDNYSRKQLCLLYESLENCKLAVDRELAAVSKALSRFGGALPQPARDQARSAGHAAMVWMATLGRVDCAQHRKRRG